MAMPSSGITNATAVRTRTQAASKAGLTASALWCPGSITTVVTSKQWWQQQQPAWFRSNNPLPMAASSMITSATMQGWQLWQCGACGDSTCISYCQCMNSNRICQLAAPLEIQKLKEQSTSVNWISPSTSKATAVALWHSGSSIVTAPAAQWDGVDCI